ncbi:MAG: holin [Clostridium sp.]|uniref:holin n=1 Tax=Clostridium sp. TaxID=1506 RepID=UPI003F322D45
MDLSRFKNYGLWVSVAALVPMVLKGFGVDVLPENYNEIITSVLGILVMAGILSNPTTSNKGFLDDKETKTIE